MQTAQAVDFIVVNNKWIIEKSLWILQLPASALVIWRLYYSGLQRIYPYFLASVAVTVARSVALYPFAPTTRTYYNIWAATQPLLWLAYLLVVAELYSLVLKSYPGIYSVGRWFFFAGVTTAVVISALTVLPTIGAAPPRNPILYYYALIERGLVTGLAIFLVLLLALVAWFPVPLSRNLRTHCLVYSTYFFTNNVIMLYWHSGGKNTVYLASLARVSIHIACALCWGFLLSRSGEERTASLVLGRSPLEEKRLLGQLESLNATLLRTARK